MNISELSIRRPVLATVLTIIILLFGFIGYSYLGVREYPSVDNPIISVSCSYPGANADVIENQITEPLEQNINGIPGIRSLSSVSQQGQSRITVEFELSVDLETAANDVRDKVSRAQRYLPRDCDPPTVSKADADAMPILMVALQSDKRSLLELSEIADLTVKEQLQTISDVSSVSIWGEKRYSMRLWLDPVKMAGYGITPIDVKNAVDNENVELPSGSIEGNTTELTIRTLGLMHTADEFNNLIVKEDKKGETLEANKQDAITTAFKSQLPKMDKVEFNVMTQALGENSAPVMITQSEYMRRMKEMANIQAGMSFYGEMPDMFNLILNSDHKLIKQVLNEEESACQAEVAPILSEMDNVNKQRNELKDKQKDKKEEEIPTSEKDELNNLDKKWDDLKGKKEAIFIGYASNNKVIRQLIDLALLQNNMLRGEALNNFVKRSIELI